ncbi:MAG: GMC oxidoreductase [Nitriliruptorales bacterium]|nr:GMC oxidoreductase [Nitriliruptorales bacterium]
MSSRPKTRRAERVPRAGRPRGRPPTARRPHRRRTFRSARRRQQPRVEPCPPDRGYDQARHGAVARCGPNRSGGSILTPVLERAAESWDADPKGRRRMAALRAACDAFVPAVEPPRAAPSFGGFWMRTPSDLGLERLAAGWIDTRMRPADREGLIQLLDLLAVTGFARLPERVRARMLKTAVRGTNDVARGFRGLCELTVGLFYGLPGPGGGNVNWDVLAYPGPPAIDPPADRPRLRPWTPPPGHGDLTLSADVVVVGSGSGGGVVAGVLAQGGLDVVVVESGGHHEEHNFPADELEAYHRMYWRGSWALTDDNTVKVGAGATLGGGSTINWTNWVQPPAWVRREWADHGLTDIDTAKFDEHLRAVSERCSATQDCSDPNGPNERLQDGADALGWSTVCTSRNTDPSTYDPATAGHIGFGDRSGSKQGTLNTYLADAAAHGARLLVNCRVDRITTTGGRAGGVAAEYDDNGTRRRVTVTAPTVVVAAGALETPAVLLRSGIGGPATGRYLRLHPVVVGAGFYGEDQRAWWGAPHSRIVDEFARRDDGYGFLIEGVQYGPGYMAGSLPWNSGRQHKVLMSGLSRAATLIGLVRDRGHGRVTLDDNGDSFVTYPLDDPHTIQRLAEALDATTRLHAAAGARGIVDLTPDKQRVWRRGQDLDRFLAGADAVPFRLPYRLIGSAHQMGSARMGTDPVTSVADPEGRLHDTPGVWIGDTSAFPTPTGANPMLTCMALAHRTAHAILARR